MSYDADKIQEIIGYKFSDKKLLERAFIHKSYHGNLNNGNNERLEFLGDSVLGFVIADFIYRNLKKSDEGKMTKLKQLYVSTKPLAEAIKRLGLQKYLICGKSLNYDVSQNNGLLENLFEAIVASIYLDGGIENARDFITSSLINVVSSQETEKRDDYKSELQIYTQSKKLGVPTYETLSKTGPEHQPQFSVGVFVAGRQIAIGIGKNTSIASQDAAKRALKILTRQE